MQPPRQASEKSAHSGLQATRPELPPVWPKQTDKRKLACPADQEGALGRIKRRPPHRMGRDEILR